MFDYKEIERTIKDNHLPFQEIGDVDKEKALEERKKNIMKFVNRIIVAILSRTFYNKNDS